MKKLLFIAFATVFLLACNQSANTEKTNTDTLLTTDKPHSVEDSIVHLTSMDKNNRKLDMEFNNTKGTATLILKNDTIHLQEQKSASGIWYTNEHYDLSGKGNDIQLKKDGKLIFEHKDEIVNSQAKNTKGDILDMVFNNTTGEAKLYLNGGEEILLQQQIMGSGIRYANDHYELLGKGDQVTLKKDGEIIFKN